MTERYLGQMPRPYRLRVGDRTIQPSGGAIARLQLSVEAIALSQSSGGAIAQLMFTTRLALPLGKLELVLGQ